jgi:hypothetical protein
MKALIDSGRFLFKNYYAEWFSQMRLRVEEFEKMSGTSYLQYLGWLHETKRTDSPSTRFEFLSRVAQAHFHQFK